EPALRVPTRHLGADEARADVVHVDAIERQLDGEAPREARERALARRVGRELPRVSSNRACKAHRWPSRLRRCARERAPRASAKMRVRRDGVAGPGACRSIETTDRP